MIDETDSERGRDRPRVTQPIYKVGKGLGNPSVSGSLTRRNFYNIPYLNSFVWAEAFLFLETPDLSRIRSKVVFQDLLSRIPQGTAVGNGSEILIVSGVGGGHFRSMLR